MEAVVFPSELGCFDQNGFTSTAKQGKPYLGRKAAEDRKSTISVKFIMKTKADTNVLLYWWVNKAKYGLVYFEIPELHFFGDYYAALVSMTNDLTINLNDDGTYSTVLNLQIHESLENITLMPPSIITDLSATDDKEGIIWITWSGATGNPTYDLYTGDPNGTNSLIATGVTSPYSDEYVGTRDYFVIATNSKGSSTSNVDEGTGGEMPSAVTDFTASDDHVGEIVFTWTAASGWLEPTYNIKDFYNGQMIATGITGNTYTWTVTEAIDQHRFVIYSVNQLGKVEGNADYGTAYKTPDAITDFNATDGDIGSTVLTWTNVDALPEAIYDLYRDGILVALNIQSGYRYDTAGGTYDLFIRANNAYGSSDSNVETITVLSCPLVTNPSASDDQYNLITIIWDEDDSCGSVDLYDVGEAAIVATDITSPYEHYATGTHTFKLISYNDTDTCETEEFTGYADFAYFIAHVESSDSFRINFSEDSQYSIDGGVTWHTIVADGADLEEGSYIFRNITTPTQVIFNDTFIDSPITKITKLSSVQSPSVEEMFKGCTKITSIDVSHLDTSSVAIFDNMFLNCANLSEISGLNNLDTSNATSLNSVFRSSGLTGHVDISQWNLSLCDNSRDLFANASNIASVAMPDTVGVDGMDQMFYDCTNLICIDRINTVEATKRSDIFDKCPNLVAPNATEQDDIKNGANWINSNACP